LTATASGGTQINLAWTDNSTDELGFKIERSTDNVNFTQITTVAANVVTSHTGVTSGTTYYYRVRAYKDGGANTTYDPPIPTPQRHADSAAGYGRDRRQVRDGKPVADVHRFRHESKSTRDTTTWQDFESFADNAPNDTVTFRRPSNSGSTSSYLDSSTNYTSVRSAFPTGHSSAKF